MRSVSILPVVCSLLVIAMEMPRVALAQAAVETRAALRDLVEELLRELDAPALADRTRAERKLLDLGPDVLPLLPAPELTPSVSVREAVKRIRVPLERRAARESALPSRVSLRGETTVAELLRQIEKQTRNRVELSEAASGAAKQSLTVEFDNQSFWDCVDDVCKRLNLRAAFDPQRAVLNLAPRTNADPVELVVQRVGPFRLAIRSAEIRPVVGEIDRRLLRVAGRLAVEPRLRPLFLHFAASDLVVLADRKPLETWNPEAKYEHPAGDAGRELAVQFDYVLPSNLKVSHVDLRGKMSLQLAAATERIVFDKTSQTPGASRRRGGVTVRLREVTFESLVENQLRAEIGVAVSYDTGGPAFESHRTWMFHNAVYLETEDGRRANFTEYDTTAQADGAVAATYRWDMLAVPAAQYRFVYEAPTLILDLPLEVKLDGIPVTTQKEQP